uniref:Secreted protein n=1 Tax=Cacopsylla melanoneura TaxID=428564 RepID=A0A8D8Y285_9HEMI
MIVTFSSSCRSAVIILLLTASHLTHFLSTSSVHTSATPSLALTSMLTPEYFKRYLSSSVSSPFPFDKFQQVNNPRPENLTHARFNRRPPLNILLCLFKFFRRHFQLI